jgi:hypothetical protein
MDDDDVTKFQMHEFCDKARAAIAAERVTMIACDGDHTNMSCATKDDSTSEGDVLANLVCDLARAIVSIYPQIAVHIHTPTGDPIVISSDTAHITVTRRLIEEV